MKPAEEYALDLDAWFDDIEQTKMTEFVRAIQFDAIRHGMTLASEISLKAETENNKFECARHILTARDNLKELP